ncbi:GSCFA domain-containing protein (plasmid) [Azospirillum sp. HJ39]|uniref:GSCFA domain-containing protein n=1 Tax=Azospirillum sp. HJ39 TaxID=3159496 RepID=UPI0035564EE0
MTEPISPPLHANPWRYPTSHDLFGSPERVAREMMVAQIGPTEPFVTPESVILTQGSCFSGNIARELQAFGCRCIHADLVEFNNTTFHNRLLIDLALGAVPLDAENERFVAEILRGVSLSEFRDLLHTADILIFTIGVALCPFDELGGLFLPLERTARARRLRMTTPEENADNMRYILRSISRINPNARFILTVSPVPLGGVPRDFPSSFAADCVSKSIMRLAAHYIEADRTPNLWYWPSFEMVRWLGSHTGPVFGVDDGNPRHVSHASVRMIIRLFLEKFGNDALRARARQMNAGES